MNSPQIHRVLNVWRKIVVIFPRKLQLSDPEVLKKYLKTRTYVKLVQVVMFNEVSIEAMRSNNILVFFNLCVVNKQTFEIVFKKIIVFILVYLNS
jgi:hypothetical protein